MISEILKSVSSRIGILGVRNSALNPFLWACFIIPTISWTAAYFFSDDADAKRLLIYVGIIPIIVFSLVGTLFALRDPRRLQSEEYQLKQQTLSIIESKGGSIVIENANLMEISNPAVLELEHIDGE